MERPRIIFLSEKDPLSKKDWSGIPYFMYHALQKWYNVEHIKAPSFRTIKLLGYYFGKVFSFFTGKKYIFDYGLILAWCFGRYYSRALKYKQGYAFIFVPAGLTEIAFIETKIPIIGFGDCSIVQLFNYYPSLNDASSLSVRELRYVELKALNKLQLALFSSSWASDFVKHEFKFERTSTIPFGSNITLSPKTKDRAPSLERCNLLFVGVDWKRKSGDTVLKIHQSLVEKGIKSSLTIIGSTPPLNTKLSDNIHIIDNLDKDSIDGERKFVSILEQTDFFLLPTLADCTPIVIAEAFSAGIPVLASRTGGIPSMVQSESNGFLFDPSDVNGYVEKIMELLKNPTKYNTISKKCIISSNETYNWNRWAEEVRNASIAYIK